MRVFFENSKRKYLTRCVSAIKIAYTTRVIQMDANQFTQYYKIKIKLLKCFMQVQCQNNSFRFVRTILALILHEMSTTMADQQVVIWAVLSRRGVALLAFALLALEHHHMITQFRTIFAHRATYMLLFLFGKSRKFQVFSPPSEVSGVTYVDAFIAQGY